MTTTQTTKTIEIRILRTSRQKTFNEVVRLIKQAGGIFDGDRKVWTVTYDPASMVLHPNAVERYGEAVAAMNQFTAGRFGFYAADTEIEPGE